MKTHIFKRIPFFAIFAVIVTTLLSIFVTYHWFSGGTILYYWDANVPLDIQVSLNAFLYPWVSNKLPGFTGSGWSWLPYWGILTLFKKLSFSLSTSQFLLYTLLIIGSIGNFYFLFKRLASDLLGKKDMVLIKFVSLLFGIGYALNVYTFYYAYFMFNPEVFIICLFPLNFLALYSLFPIQNTPMVAQRKNLWLFIFFITQIFMIPGFTSYVFLLQYFGLLGFYFLLFLYFSKSNVFSKQNVSFILVLLITGLLHWSWFYGAKLGFDELYASQITVGNLDDFEILSKNMSLLNLFRLFGGSMMNNNAFVWDQLLLSQSIISLPLFLFAFLIAYLFLKMKRMNKHVIILFFSAILLGALFIMKMGNPPFMQFMQWLIKTVPYVSAFRESVQKAGLYFLFPYFFLSGLGLLLFIGSLKKVVYKVVCMVIFVLPAFILLSSPFLLFRSNNIKTIDFYFNKNKNTFSSKTVIPPEYYELKKFIEPKCIGKNTLVYPRTGLISNAIWEKYKASYVGQDYLSALINCPFSSAEVLNTESEAARTAVYGFINDHNILDVKKYLIANRFHYILVQKDSVPYLYTSRPDEDFFTVESWFMKDNDFVNSFSNEYFTLFEFRPLQDDASYGFSLTSNAMYTNATLTKSNEYKNIYHSIGEAYTPMIFQTGELVETYKSLVKVYNVQSNCVGCVKVQTSKTQQNINRSFLEKAKELIKPYVKKGDVLSEDQKISMELIRMNNVFQDLLLALRSQDYQSVIEYIPQYVTIFTEQKNRLDSYQGDFFAINNKLIEMRNFVIGENDLLKGYLDNNTEDIKKYSFDKLFLVEILQKDFIKYADDHIWETDSEKYSYKARLDIPVEGEYSCSAQTENQLKINEVALNGVSLASSINRSSNFIDISIELKKGSYPLDIAYSNTEILGLKEVGNSKANIYELSNLPNGSYALGFSALSILPNKYIAFITNIELQKGDLDNIVSGTLASERIISMKRFETSYQPKDVQLVFTLDELSRNQYYFYIVGLDSREVVLQVEDIGLHRVASESSIIFNCYLNTTDLVSMDEQPKINRINPVTYEVVLPKDSKAAFLIFSQTYHSDWKAYVIKNNKKEYLKHIKNGFSNAWVVDGVQDQIIYIQFERWPQIIKNFILCISLGLLVSGVLLYISYDKKRNR